MINYTDKIDDTKTVDSLLLAKEITSVFREQKNFISPIEVPNPNIDNQMLNTMDIMSKKLHYRASGDSEELVLIRDGLKIELEIYYEGITGFFIPTITNTVGSTYTMRLASLPDIHPLFKNKELNPGDIIANELHYFVYTDNTFIVYPLTGPMVKDTPIISTGMITTPRIKIENNMAVLPSYASGDVVLGIAMIEMENPDSETVVIKEVYCSIDENNRNRVIFNSTDSELEGKYAILSYFTN